MALARAAGSYQYASCASMHLQDPVRLRREPRSHGRPSALVRSNAMARSDLRTRTVAPASTGYASPRIATLPVRSGVPPVSLRTDSSFPAEIVANTLAYPARSKHGACNVRRYPRGIPRKVTRSTSRKGGDSAGEFGGSQPVEGMQ